MLENNYKQKQVTQEIFQTFKPKSEILKKYIDSFYFHKDDNSIKSKKIVFFPNTKNALTIYKNAKRVVISKKPMHIKITNHESYNYLYFYGGIQHNAIITEINTPFDKIGIIFHPLGMNHFIIENYTGREIRSDYHFPPIERKLKLIIDSVYGTDNFGERLEILENFFIDNLNKDFNEPIVEKAINLLENFNGKLKISQLADKLNVEEKTLLRKFRNHLNCTPKHYAKVLKFRKALTLHINSKEKRNLTDLAHNQHYYDQSDFIKSFKSLTGKNPSFFFNQVEDLGNDIYWFK